MQISKNNSNIRSDIHGFERRIDQMHQDFYKYYNGLESKVPNWEVLERELVLYSKKRIFDIELSKNLDRILYKFQNRKKIWLNWVEEYHHSLEKEEEDIEEENQE